MPNDLVWVALITSGAVLASAWLTARFTDKSAQRQINAQAESTNAQIVAQAEIMRSQIALQKSESRRDRIINARTDTLTQIRDSLGALFGAHSTFSSSIINLQSMKKIGIESSSPGHKRMEYEIERQEEIIHTETAKLCVSDTASRTSRR